MMSAFERVSRELLRSSANRPDAQDLIMFLTDGFPNPQHQRPSDWTTKQIRDRGTRIFGIGITDKVLFIFMNIL